MEKQKYFQEGKNLWFEYIRINGYSFQPTSIGIGKLSRLLDLNKSYIKKCINAYLEA